MGTRAGEVLSDVIAGTADAIDAYLGVIAARGGRVVGVHRTLASEPDEAEWFAARIDYIDDGQPTAWGRLRHWVANAIAAT